MILKLVLAIVSVFALGASPAVAQQVTAEVRTWSGQSFTVNDPT